MHARKLAVPLFALVVGLLAAGFVGAAMTETPTADAAQPTEKACCKHHDAADKTGMHCDHAKMKAQGEEGKACCAKHASMHKEGAAPADTQACCAKHAAMNKDGEKGGCCEDACPHHTAQEAPAKS